MIRGLLLFVQTRLFMLNSLVLINLLSLETLRNALNALGYPAVVLFIMVESSGIPFPGETMLLLAAFYAAVDHTLQIPVVIACAALGAILGDNIGYIAGKKGGYRLVRRFGRYIFLKPEHLEKAERFFARHGNKTVFFGRFIAVLRAWSAFLAGINRMPWSTFLFYNAAGGIVWAIFYGCLGFYVGQIFHDNFDMVQGVASTISWLGTILVVLIISIAVTIFLLRRRRNQEKPGSPSEKVEMPEEPTESAPARTTGHL